MSKKIENVYHEIIDFDNLYKAYKKALKGKNKYTKEALIFQEDETLNLLKLQKELKDKTYEFGTYTQFYIYEPKERLIHAPSFKDKIVQLALNNVLKEYYNKTFIYDSYGSIDNKGTHRCVDKIQHNLRQAKWEYGDKAYIVKFDIKKFFYSIDRDILKKIYKKKIKDKDTLDLLFKIVDSANQIDEKGLPLGNTISQLSANVYLNELDQYAKRVLRLKYYVRYMDDVIVVVEDKEKANEIKDKLVHFVERNLNIKANLDKTQIFPISQGINSVGFKIYTTHRLLRNSSKKKVKRKIKSFPNLINNKNITQVKCEEMLNSWHSHASYGNVYKFESSLLEKYKYIYKSTRNQFKLRIGFKNKRYSYLRTQKKGQTKSYEKTYFTA